jgi:hypothetical protein
MPYTTFAMWDVDPIGAFHELCKIYAHSSKGTSYVWEKRNLFQLGIWDVFFNEPQVIKAPHTWVHVLVDTCITLVETFLFCYNILKT